MLTDSKPKNRKEILTDIEGRNQIVYQYCLFSKRVGMYGTYGIRLHQYPVGDTGDVPIPGKRNRTRLQTSRSSSWVEKQCLLPYLSPRISNKQGCQLHRRVLSTTSRWIPYKKQWRRSNFHFNDVNNVIRAKLRYQDTWNDIIKKLLWTRM